MKITKEVKAGISTLLILFLTYWGVNYLKSSNIFDSRDYYKMSIVDATTIESSTPIHIRGVKVGAITSVELEDVKSNIKLELSIKSQYKIPKDSYIQLAQIGIMDAPILELIPGTSDEYYQDGDIIKYVETKGMLDTMNDLVAMATSVMNNIDSTLVQAQKILSDNNVEKISKMVSNLESASNSLDKTIASQKDRIGNILANVEGISNTLNSATPEIKEALGNFSSLSSNLNKSLPELLGDVDSLMKKINSTEGTIGNLINNDSLYGSLDSLTTNLNTFLNDFKEHPKKYINVSVFSKRTGQEKVDLYLSKQKIKELKKNSK